MSSTSIIKNELAVTTHSWTNKDGSVSHRFAVRIRQKQHASYFRKTLKALTLPEAQKEALQVYMSLQDDLSAGKKISVGTKNLVKHIDAYLDAKQKEADGGFISGKRVEVIKHHLLPLERFWVYLKKPSLDVLITEYDQQFRAFRTSERVLKASSRQSEETTHKVFFKWCFERNYCTRLSNLKGKEERKISPNRPFPRNCWKKLLAAIRKDIKNARTERHRFNLLTYYHAILTMGNIGCRVPEIRNMKWKHLSKQGDEDRLYIHGKAKERTVVISPRVAENLERLKKYQEKFEKRGEYIFVVWETGKPFKRMNTVLKDRWFEAAGVPPKDYELVCLRHMFVVNALNRNVNTLAIAKYIGTSQKMIETTYSGLVSKETYDLVFAGISEQALSPKGITPRFLDLED
jgi:integrase